MAPKPVDEDLAKTLIQAKKKPRNFAIVAKGVNCLKLILNRKPLKAGDLQKAKMEVGGNKIYRGVCQGDGGKDMVFRVTDEEPAINVKKLKLFVADSAGLALKPRFEVVAELEEVNEEGPDDEGLETGAEATSPEDEAEMSAENRAMKQLTAALAKLAPAITQAIAAQPARKAELLAQVTSIKEAIQAGEPEAAKAQLLSTGKLVMQLAAASTDDTDSTDGDDDEDIEEDQDETSTRLAIEGIDVSESNEELQDITGDMLAALKRTQALRGGIIYVKDVRELATEYLRLTPADQSTLDAKIQDMTQKQNTGFTTADDTIVLLRPDPATPEQLEAVNHDAVHESVHTASAAGGITKIMTSFGASLNEAFTEYFTHISCAKQGVAVTAAYSKELWFANRLQRAIGDGPLVAAYLQDGGITPIVNAVAARWVSRTDDGTVLREFLQKNSTKTRMGFSDKRYLAAGRGDDPKEVVLGMLQSSDRWKQGDITTSNNTMWQYMLGDNL